MALTLLAGYHKGTSLWKIPIQQSTIDDPWKSKKWLCAYQNRQMYTNTQN